MQPYVTGVLLLSFM